MGTALITGATSGIGLELAWQLAEAHHDLVLVARSRESLTAVAEQLCQVAGVGVEVLPADLSTSEGLTAVAERLRLEPTVARATSSSEHARVGDVAARPIDLLVNNAGFAVGQVFVGGDLRQERRALAVMVSAVMELTHAALPGMVARGHGAILNISSVTALTAMGTYAAHKAWVRTFTEGLVSELRGTGVTATVVNPGLTAPSSTNGPVWTRRPGRTSSGCGRGRGARRPGCRAPGAGHLHAERAIPDRQCRSADRPALVRATRGRARQRAHAVLRTRAGASARRWRTGGGGREGPLGVEPGLVGLIGDVVGESSLRSARSRGSDLIRRVDLTQRFCISLDA